MDALVGSVIFIVRPDGVRVAIDNGIYWSTLNLTGVEREKLVFTRLKKSLFYNVRPTC